MKALFERLMNFKKTISVESNENDKMSNLIRQNRLMQYSTVFFWLLLILAIIFSAHSQGHHLSQYTLAENQQAKVIYTQLSDINAQLQQLSSSQNDADFKTTILHINTDLSAIEKSVNTLAKTSDIQKMSNQLLSMQNDVDKQMLDLKRIIASNSKDYLDPKVLPFHVISIDVISQQPFVSIDYSHLITPLTVGDSLAGWQITSADYSAGYVEFKNDRNQYVKVTLQG